jgi:hypothetical protein
LLDIVQLKASDGEYMSKKRQPGWFFPIVLQARAAMLVARDDTLACGLV